MRTYPKIGSLVTVEYHWTKAGRRHTGSYTGTVFADRYPDSALNLGELRIPWANVDSVTNR